MGRRVTHTPAIHRAPGRDGPNLLSCTGPTVELVVQASCSARTGAGAGDPYAAAHAARDAVAAPEPVLER